MSRRDAMVHRDAPSSPPAAPDPAPAVQVLLFVYGSLKQGFPNAHVNTGRRVEGRFRTCEPHPMLLLGPGQVPCLVNAPGQGGQVEGELYAVDAHGQAAMDRLERLGERGGYQRLRLRVERMDVAGGTPIEAQAYLRDPHEIPPGVPRQGPFTVYTHAQARHLFW